MATAPSRRQSPCSRRWKASISWRPPVHAYVLPAAVVILLALFAVQRFGTAAIGVAFGPVMAAWFLVIAGLGLYGIAQHPAVLWALNPLYGLSFLFSGGAAGFLVLGGVFLCVTGAEALYADMGHFGPRPIRLAWSAVVLPALVLNYAGQAALVMSGAPTEGNIFYPALPLAAAGAAGDTGDNRHRDRQPSRSSPAPSA